MRLMLIYSLSLLAIAPGAVSAQTVPVDSAQTVPVNVDNFKRAETDFYMARTAADGGFGQFAHNRTPTPIDKQPVVRMNRDTLYSQALFDLDAGPVTITLPDAGERFLSMQVISEAAPTRVGAPWRGGRDYRRGSVDGAPWHTARASEVRDGGQRLSPDRLQPAGEQQLSRGVRTGRTAGSGDDQALQGEWARQLGLPISAAASR